MAVISGRGMRQGADQMIVRRGQKLGVAGFDLALPANCSQCAAPREGRAAWQLLGAFPPEAA